MVIGWVLKRRTYLRRDLVFHLLPRYDVLSYGAYLEQKETKDFSDVELDGGKRIKRSNKTNDGEVQNLM